ncbi:hypothetical protein RRF57_005576 [Xylaria bambusicola]|uniref:Uncharacterized protein n=1 Tax=Xylaria bambusicola TaxID=326684 RepID=A0AAN7UQQ7_9PEZI
MAPYSDYSGNDQLSHSALAGWADYAKGLIAMAQVKKTLERTGSHLDHNAPTRSTRQRQMLHKSGRTAGRAHEPRAHDRIATPLVVRSSCSRDSIWKFD